MLFYEESEIDQGKSSKKPARYSDWFKKELKAKLGDSDLSDLSKDEKSEFFLSIDKKWNAQDEPGKDGPK